MKREQEENSMNSFIYDIPEYSGVAEPPNPMK